MESVLKKTVASLETALRYNPESIELMTSLAEGYVRMGRLDSATIALCEKVLAKNPDNMILQQAQTTYFVLQQTEQMDEALTKGQAPPPADALETSLSMLEEYLQLSADSTVAWYAWTRLCYLAGRYDDGMRGIERLKELQFDHLEDLKRILDSIGRRPATETVDWLALYRAYMEVTDERNAIRMLERVFDKSISRKEVGAILLKNYLNKYSLSHPEEVPEAIRPRFFQLLLDYGDSNLTSEWLRKASIYGWQVTAHSKAFVKSLIEDDQLESAFEILRRMTLDNEIKDMLNSIAAHYEKHEQIDDAVRILQFINTNELSETEMHKNQEIELNRSMEMSLAELQVKNGRLSEALSKFISALCLYPETDPAVLARIDDLIARGIRCDVRSLLRLAGYFRNQGDLNHTMQYISLVLNENTSDTACDQELETMFEDILTASPDTARIRIFRGEFNRRRGKIEEAITDFKIAAADPELTEEANRLLARAYHSAGQTREALNRYQTLSIGPEDLDPLYQLHLEFSRGDDPRSALAILNMIRAVDSDYRDVNERIRQLDERPSGRSNQGYQGGSTPEGENKMRELIGDLAIGRYQYMDKIGSGGMGVVHKIMDTRQNKVMAMKILRDGLASSSKALDRFFREARIAAQIRHRNIVDIFDYNISSQDGQNYIVMEFIEGQSLREFIDLHFDDTISTSIEYITEMLYYGVQLFDALQATHAKGIIHRDIKPDNIMITPFGDVKITDFGIVHVEEATFTPTGAMLGTPRYMAPEQVTGQRVDGRSDIYSVGILLYEVLTGSPPFMTGDISYQQVNKQAVEPRLINSVIPQSVNNFILKCLEKKPENRFPTAGDARDAIAEILRSLGGCKKFDSQTPSKPHTTERQKIAPQSAKAGKSVDPDLDLSPVSDLDKLELEDLDLD